MAGKAAPPRRTWLALATLGLVIILGLAAAVGLAALLLNPPRQEVELLAASLALSGVLSLAIGYLGVRLGWRLRWAGLQVKIALAIAIGSLVALANVATTAALMFLSPHDLILLSLLLGFALLLSWAFGVYLAGSVTQGIRTLAAGARQMAEGDLGVRVHLPVDDEVGDLAQAFNQMATQVEAAFQRQRELESARRDLMGAISHDLRTPLASLQAMVEALADGVVSDAATTQRYLRTMQAEIHHLNALINDLFELSQLDAGVLRLHLQPSKVEALLAATVAAAQMQAEQKALQLVSQSDVTLSPVMADPIRVQQVLTNLVQNAIRHTPDGGLVRLEARDAGRMIEFSVVDTGEGIAERNLEHVFERFFRGDPARTRAPGGVGLGLAIARGLVEAHGGQIRAESTLGRGTAFRFTLPKMV